MMVSISLDSNYRIESDGRQWILAEKSGKDWRFLAFFMTLEPLLRYYAELALRQSEASTVQELRQISQDLKQAIREAVSKVSYNGKA